MAPPGRPVPLRDRRGAEFRRRGDGRAAELQAAGVRGPPPFHPPVPSRLLFAGPVREAGRVRGPDGPLAGRTRPGPGQDAGQDQARAGPVPDDGDRGRGPGRPAQPSFPAHLPHPRRVAGAAPVHPGRHRGPVPRAVLQRPAQLQPPADRGVPRAAGLARQIDRQLALDPRHGGLLRPGNLPGRDVGDLRRPRLAAGAHRAAARGPAARGRDVRIEADVLRHQRHLDGQQDRRAGTGPAGRHRPGRPELPPVPPLRADAGRRHGDLPRRLPPQPVLDVRRRPAAPRSRASYWTCGGRASSTGSRCCC